MDSRYTFKDFFLYQKHTKISLQASRITRKARVLKLEKEMVEAKNGEALKRLEPLHRATTPQVGFELYTPTPYVTKIYASACMYIMTYAPA